MVNVFKGLIIIASIALMSCAGSEEENTDFQMVLNNKKIYLLPGSTYSCKALYNAKLDGTSPSATDITEKYFSIKNLSFKWAGSTEFNLQYVKVSFSSSVVTVSDVIISAEELAAAANYNFSTGSLNTVPNTYNGGAITSSNPLDFTCPIKVGGISIPSTNNKEFQINAKITAVGTYSDGEQELPASTSQEITIINTAI